MKENINYIIDLENESEALVFKVKKAEKSYSFFILGSLLFENGLQIWVKNENYYKKFIDQNVESFISGVEKGQYIPMENGNIFISRDNYSQF
ncbi:MAG: hypothetical protein ABIP51_17645 [Bacteroidia bacterium]